MAKRQHGMRVDVSLFVPYDPANPDSVVAASAAAKKLTTTEGLKEISSDVVILDAKTVASSRATPA